MNQQITTFYVGDTLLGLNILLVKEIYRQRALTPIPSAPKELLGLMNLRGKVVTVVDLNTCLKRPEREVPEDSALLILKTDAEIQGFKDDEKLPDLSVGEDIVGLLIDKMDNVLDIPEEDILPTPPNLDTIEKEFIQGVIKQGRSLVIMLDIAALLNKVESVTCAVES